MTDSTHNNGHKTWWKEAGKEGILGLGIAEGVAIVTSLGVVAVADQVAPTLLKNTTSTIAKILEPYLLNPTEWFLEKACRLEECKTDAEQSRQERAEALVSRVIVFSAAFAASLVTKIATRKTLNYAMGIHSSHGRSIEKDGFTRWFMHEFIIPDKHDRQVMYWDEGFHYGSLILLNTGVAKHTDDGIRVSRKILETMGVSKKKAKELAEMLMIWEVPNLIGWLAGAGRIGYENYHKYGVVKSAIDHGKQPPPEPPL